MAYWGDWWSVVEDVMEYLLCQQGEKPEVCPPVDEPFNWIQ